MPKANVVNKVKHLIGTKCPCCKRGELKKKYNRSVSPAKPFVGCTSYPKCDYSIEMDGSAPKIGWEEDAFSSIHPHSSIALGQD